MSLALEWRAGRPVSARLEQEEEIGDEDFARLTAEYGAGAAWHEFDDGTKPYEGLVQQWYLQGYGRQDGWLGSGVHRGRYFLVFRETPPAAMAKVEAPLSLKPAVAAFLDTSSRWLESECRDAQWPAGEPSRAAPGKPAGKKAAARGGNPRWGNPYATNPARTPASGCACCASPRRPWKSSSRRGKARRSRRSAAWSRLIPDAGQAEYAKDLSQMLLTESQIFLAKLAQALPGPVQLALLAAPGIQGGRPASRALPGIGAQREGARRVPSGPAPGRPEHPPGRKSILQGYLPPGCGGQAMSELKPVYTASSEPEAEIIRNLLAGAGIESQLTTDDGGGMIQSLTYASGITLLVEEKSYADAMTVLDEYRKGETALREEDDA